MDIDFSTFDTFLNDTLGQPIGNLECWDYINLLWSHTGNKYWTYPPSDPSATNHGVKWGWINVEARLANTIMNTIIRIDSLDEVQRGDVVIISDGEYGHGGFASSSYDGSGFLGLYSQNYNNWKIVKYDAISMSNFLGAFRYTQWNTAPVIEGERRFPWFIYSRKLRDRRMGL